MQGSWPGAASRLSLLVRPPRGWIPFPRAWVSAFVPGSREVGAPAPPRSPRPRPGPPPGARHFLHGPVKALPGGGGGGSNSVRVMVALENPECGPEAAEGTAGGRRLL